MTSAMKSFDFLNLQRPVPASDYFFRAEHIFNGRKMNNGTVSFASVGPITETGWYGVTAATVSNDYQANLAVPPQLRAMDPAWKDCILDLDGMKMHCYPARPPSDGANVYS